MQIRFTSSLGLPVVEEEGTQALGTVSGTLIHPDTGVIEGFFVRTTGMFMKENLFLTVSDILHWGTRITIRHADMLSPLADRVRLEHLANEDRPVLGQKMKTTDDEVLGRCADVQFDTRDFRLQWLFPKKFFRWGTPLPASAILRVTKEAIVVRTTTLGAEDDGEAVRVLPPVPEAA